MYEMIQIKEKKKQDGKPEIQAGVEIKEIMEIRI